MLFVFGVALFAALSKESFAFMPLYLPKDTLFSTSKGCASNIYRYDVSFPIFEDNFGEASFGGGGKIGLSGGIETAIDPDFCRYMIYSEKGFGRKNRNFEEKCDHLILAIQRAANIWR